MNNENEISETSVWLEGFKASLPEGWSEAVDHASAWIEENPSTAALIGTAAGFSLGFLGVRKIWKGVAFARRTPLIAGLAIQAASSVAGSIAAHRKERE